MAVRSLRTGALALVVAAVAPSAALAHDTLAPRDAPHHWLPDEAWVSRHWVPFDERDLNRALGLRGRELEAYLYNDHRTLAALAAARRLELNAVVDDLLASWPAGDSMGPVRRDHTVRILTQGHLAQHVFFHVFHTDFERQGGPRLFGLSGRRYWRLRARGATPHEIARRSGVAPKRVRAGMIRILQRARRQGIALGLAHPAEADRLLARQLAALRCWMQSPISPLDSGNPYGKGGHLHGMHPRDWPTTAADRRAADRRVEMIRRALPPSCWRPPPPWSWPEHGLPIP